MRKLLLIALSLLVFASGCVKDDERVKIQFASWGSKTEVEIIKDVIKDFEARTPDVKVEFLHIPQNYFQKIHLLFASNTEPDVIFLNNHYLPVYVNADKLLPLSVPENVYDEKVLAALSYDGEVYALPRDISLLVVYYNRDLLRRAGVGVPKYDWTFEDFLDTARKVKKNTGMFGVSFEEDPLFYLPYLMSEGGGVFEIESENSKRALTFYADLRKKYHVAPRREDIASATMAQMFLQGKIAMQVSGRWLTPKYNEEAKFDWGVTTFPAGSKGSVVPLDASGWAVAKSSKHQTEALKFVNYLGSREVMEKFAKTGLIVPARSDVEFEGSEVYSRALKTAKPTPVSVDYNKVLDNLKIKMETVFN